MATMSRKARTQIVLGCSAFAAWEKTTDILPLAEQHTHEDRTLPEAAVASTRQSHALDTHSSFGRAVAVKVSHASVTTRY